MALCPQHRFRLVTAFPERFSDYVRTITEDESPIGGITSYRGGEKSTFDDPMLLEIAKQHGKSAAQVMLAGICSKTARRFPSPPSLLVSPSDPFLAAHDLSGKTLIPLITHGGYGLGDSLDVLARHVRRANLVQGFSMQAPQERQTVDFHPEVSRVGA